MPAHSPRVSWCWWVFWCAKILKQPYALIRDWRVEKRWRRFNRNLCRQAFQHHATVLRN